MLGLGSEWSCLFFWLAFSSILIGHLVIIWSVHVFPFVDLPDHLATATILRYFGATGTQFDKYYSIGSLMGKPNVLHYMFCSSSLFPSVEVANRVYYSIYAILLPVSVLLVIRKCGGERWNALLSFLLMYNLSACWGFAGFTLSIPVLFVFFYVVIQYVDRSSFYFEVAIALLFIAFFLLHALMTVFALSLYAVLVMYCFAKPDKKRFVRSIVPMLPVVTIVLFWWNSREISSGAGIGFFSSLITYYSQHYVETFIERSRLVVFDNYFLFPGMLGYATAGLFFVVIVIPVVLWGIKAPYRASAAGLPNEKSVKCVLLLSGWSLFCFLSLPGEIFNFQVLYQRFSVVFLLSVIVVGGSLSSTKSYRTVKFITCAACVMHLVLWSHYFASFDEANRCFNKDFFPKDSEQKTLGGLIYDLKFRGKPVYVHFPSYYIVWTHGVATFRIVDLIDFAPPLRRKLNGNPIPEYQEWAWLSTELGHTYAKLDYLLVRGAVPSASEHALLDHRLLNRCGEWRLYKVIGK